MVRRGWEGLLAAGWLVVALLTWPIAVVAESPVKLNIADGDIVITASGYRQGNGGEVAHTGPYEVTGQSSQHAITVESGEQEMTLSGVSIDA